MAGISFVLSAPAVIGLVVPAVELQAPLIGDSIILARDESLLATAASPVAHVPVTSTAVNLELAMVTAEDIRFHDHRGVDLVGLVRSVINNARGLPVQGGSTITQQLVRNETGIGRQRSIERKLREIVLAVRLERSHDKDWILRRYLNTIWLGNGTQGAGTAAQAWFGVPVEQLSLGQAAAIAVTAPCPERCNPVTNPDENERRRQLLLDIIATEELASPDEIAEARTPSTLTYTKPVRRSSGDPWVLDSVRRELRAAGLPGFEDGAWPGGYIIRTGIDPNTQRIATESIASVLGDPTISATSLEAASSFIDPATGEVRAIVGGRDFSIRQVNAALGVRGGGSGRQGGSTAKTFALIAALERGFDADSLIDAPYRVDINGKPVYNSDGRSWGSITLATATARSVNTAFINLATLVGPAEVGEVARRFGVTVPSTLDERVAIGVLETDPLAMASVMATIANDGIRHTPHLVVSVEAGDRILFTTPVDPERVIDVRVAQRAQQILRGSVRNGTGWRANLYDEDRRIDVIGKTGTTNNAADTWFIGATSQLAGAVWIGNAHSNTATAAVPGFEYAAGGEAPAEIWRRTVQGALVLPVEALSAAERPFVYSPRPSGTVDDVPVQDGAETLPYPGATTEPTTEPTTDPSTDPTTDPTTGPTTGPTIGPTTGPTTGPETSPTDSNPPTDTRPGPGT